MQFSYNWLREYVKEMPRVEKLAKILNMRAFEIEELKKVGKDFLLDVSILANRASDCFSHIGMAREISAILGLDLKLPKIRAERKKLNDEKGLIKVTIKDQKACRRYCAEVMKGIKVGPTPKKIRERIKILGLSSINNIVDILNYTMIETGQPLHAFDLDKIEGKEIIVRKAKKREKIITLDGREFELDKDILVIADKKGPLAIAGIKGGKRAEITEKTKNILIESANFTPLIIRRARQKLGIQTDASLRFEHNVPLYFAREGMERALALLQKYTGGEIWKRSIDISFQKDASKRVRLPLEKLFRLAGAEINTKEALSILKRLGFKIISQNKKAVIVKTPLWRKDVSLPEDLIEEILRIKGYDYLPAIPPKLLLSIPEKNDNIYWENIARNYLSSLGFTEVYNYSFLGENEKKYFDFKNLIEIDNPLSERQKYLRPCLLPGLLNNVRLNLKYFDHFKIFELGKVFFKTKDKSQKIKVEEKRRLSGLAVREKANEEEMFFETKGILDSFLNSLGITDYWYDNFQSYLNNLKKSAWKKFSSADIKIGNELVGSLGIISSDFLRDLGVSAYVVAFDLDFEKVQKISLGEQEYKPVSSYPAAIRDISILVPLDTRVSELLNVMNAVGGDLVSDIDLFDMYEGENLPGGRKSLAFHIVYQARDHTLASREVDSLHQKIIKAIEKNPEWEVRK